METVLRSPKEPSYPASLSRPRRKVTGFLGKLREGERGRGSPARPSRLPLPEVGAPAVTRPSSIVSPCPLPEGGTPRCSVVPRI